MISILLAAAAVTPVAEVRVTFDRRRVAVDRLEGLADRAEARKVTADDPVRIASISKLFTALGVMRMVESGRLDLDADVSARLGWPLRHPNWPEQAITLRMLLSHTSGLRDDADYVIPLGGDLRAFLANPKVWDPEHPPGRFFRYANLNSPVVASVMEAAGGERFDRLMARLVFRPLRLDACFNWTTCSDAKARRAVVLYAPDGAVRRDDLGGRRPDCPVATEGPCDLSAYRPGSNGSLFSPQGGLRISGRDLAKTGRMLLARGAGFLRPSTVSLMFTPVWRYEGANGETEGGFFCAYGLGTQTLATAVPGCRDNPFGDGRPRAGHAGEAYGLRSGLWLDFERGRGVAFYATGIPDDAERGESAFTAVEERLAKP